MEKDRSVKQKIKIDYFYDRHVCESESHDRQARWNKRNRFCKPEIKMKMFITIDRQILLEKYKFCESILDK